MNKSFMAGVISTLMVLFAASVISPSSSTTCEAGKEAKDALTAQASTISNLTKIVSDSQDVLKKSVESMSEAIKACGK